MSWPLRAVVPGVVVIVLRSRAAGDDGGIGLPSRIAAFAVQGILMLSDRPEADERDHDHAIERGVRLFQHADDFPLLTVNVRRLIRQRHAVRDLELAADRELRSLRDIRAYHRLEFLRFERFPLRSSGVD